MVLPQLWAAFDAAWSGHQHEEGAEAIEWIAMAAAVILLLVGVAAVLQGQGPGVGQMIVGAILSWISKLFGS